MTKLREAQDLSQEERGRIRRGWIENYFTGVPENYDYDDRMGDFCCTVATLMGIHEDTVRQVLREEGE